MREIWKVFTRTWFRVCPSWIGAATPVAHNLCGNHIACRTVYYLRNEILAELFRLRYSRALQCAY